VRGYCGIGLDNPKTGVNVGSAMRAAGVYGAAFVGVSGRRFDLFKRYMPTDTMKHRRHLPLFHTDDLKSLIPYDCVPVAVDIIEGALPLHEYAHPERAFYIFGAEDSTLGDRVTSWCRDVVYVPTRGCMNLAAAVNVVLYDRAAKLGFANDKPEKELTP
jgi:tRNA(Leu) C34 or U34 (ribose-2'-O)-methylase TrmL